MSIIIRRILSNWHLTKVFRLGIGMEMLAAGIQKRDWMVGLLSTIYLYQTLTNTGFCGVQGCDIPKKEKQQALHSPVLTKSTDMKRYDDTCPPLVEQFQN